MIESFYFFFLLITHRVIHESCGHLGNMVVMSKLCIYGDLMLHWFT